MYKRFLNQHELDRCENAQEPICKCRCGGTRHGAKRVPVGGDFSTLPPGDPHWRPGAGINTRKSKEESGRLLKHALAHIVVSPDRFLDADDPLYIAWSETKKIIWDASLQVLIS